MHQTGEYTISDLGELFSVSRPTVCRTRPAGIYTWRRGRIDSLGTGAAAYTPLELGRCPSVRWPRSRLRRSPGVTGRAGLVLGCPWRICGWVLNFRDAAHHRFNF